MDLLATLLRRPPPDPRPDGELLAAFLRDRDEPAFAELVRRHGPLVWAACRRALPDTADAEDAFQAAFLVLVRRARRLTAAATVGPWLLKVAVLTARNARRRNARRLARTAPLPGDVPDPRPPAEPAPDLDVALRGLSERCRAAVLLTHLEGLTHREAADRLGCAEGTVSSLVSRALAKLRTRLGREPVAVLTAAAVPAGLAGATARSAVAVHLASQSATGLAREVLRMLWIRKAAAAGVTTVAVLVAGFAAGLSVRETPSASGQEKEKAAGKPPALPPAPPPAPPAEPYIVFTVRGPANPKEVYTITEFDAKGECRWSVIPGRELAEKWAATSRLIDFPEDAVVGGAQDYLTRVRTDATAPHDLRVVVDPDARVGGLTLEALRVCRDAGFDAIRFTGYVPLGGRAPELKPGPDGEAVGYKRFKGERVDTKELLTEYAEAMRRF